MMKRGLWRLCLRSRDSLPVRRGCQDGVCKTEVALMRNFSSNLLLPPFSQCPVPPQAKPMTNLFTTQLSSGTRDLSSRAGSESSSHVTSGDGSEEEIVTPRLRHILRGLRNKQRASLAEAITLVESRHPRKHRQAQWLLSQVLTHRRKEEEGVGRLRPTVRVGLSGPPGAGKSTLVETLGLRLVESGHKVAVLAVDPTSARTGGSILGDKTRMTRLAHHPSAYIRPSPTSGSLGGVTRSTNEAIVLCEGAGYDTVLVETVGVGQSETAVNDMVDIFLLVIPPAAGDELQGIKRGIVEVSDIIVINKADGDLLPAARRIKGEYVSAVKLSRSKTPHWKTQVLMASALHSEGIGELWSAVEQFVETMRTAGVFREKRRLQRKLWMWNHIDWKLIHRFRSEPAMTEHIRQMEGEVLAGKVAPGTAADVLFERFLQVRT